MQWQGFRTGIPAPLVVIPRFVEFASIILLHPPLLHRRLSDYIKLFNKRKDKAARYDIFSLHAHISPILRAINCARSEIMKIFACCVLLSVVAASNLNASSSTVPLNDSKLIYPFTNGTLQRQDHWPPLPYVYAIDPDLSIYMTQYGNLLAESQEEVALAALVAIENQITTEGGSDDEIFATIFSEHGVFVSFQKPASATLPFRRWMAAKAIHTVQNLMIFYGAKNLPSVKVLLGKEVLSHFSVHFLIHPGGIPPPPLISVLNNSETASTDLIARSNVSTSWPPVPYTFRIKDTLQMTIFEWGLDFTASKQDVLDRLERIEMNILRRAGPDELLPTVVFASDGVAAVFGAVRYPSLTITHLQAAQAVGAVYSLIEKYGPRRIDDAEIYMVGLRLMSFKLKSSTHASGNGTSYVTLGSPSNDSVPTTPALVARSNMTLRNTNMADEPWPSLPFTVNVEDNLDVTVLEYGADFPGSRRYVLQALETIAEIITKRSSRIISTQRLSYSPVTIAFDRITGQGQGAPLLRTQATMVLEAIRKLMQDHKPRELTRTEISVGGQKAMGLSLKLYFAPVDTGNTTMEIRDTPTEIGNTTLNIGNTASELESASTDTGTF